MPLPPKNPAAFELQPTLTGELLHLRPLRADEFEALFAAASDPLIWEQHPQKTRYQREVFQTYFDGAVKSGGALVVEDRANGEVLGSSRFYDLSVATKTVTIGYTFLVRKAWGGRFNRELKDLMLRHAFRFVDFVHFEIGENNLRSRRAIEKIGARFIEKRTRDGKEHLLYRITDQSAE
jgi:hypothetical protein